MIPNPQAMQIVAREKHERLLNQSDKHRILQELRRTQFHSSVTAWQRLLWRLGDWLIALGVRLTARRRVLACQPRPDSNCGC